MVTTWENETMKPWQTPIIKVPNNREKKKEQKERTKV
jgi:hypothetical protein